VRFYQAEVIFMYGPEAKATGACAQSIQPKKLNKLNEPNKLNKPEKY